PDAQAGRRHRGALAGGFLIRSVGRARWHDEPDAADVLAVGVARGFVADEVVERDAVVRHLLRVIGAVDYLQLAGNARSQAGRLVRGHDRPVDGAIVVT